MKGQLSLYILAIEVVVNIKIKLISMRVNHLFIVWDYFSDHVFFHYRITTPISNEISNDKQVKAEKILSSSQSNQSDHSTTLHPGESTKLSASDKSQLQTTEAKPRSSQETKPSSPAPDKREDLTALKALDVLLRKYDRRSTPTNDLGTKIPH